MNLFGKNNRQERPKAPREMSEAEGIAEQERLKKLRKDLEKYCPIVFMRIDEAKRAMPEEEELPTHAEWLGQLEKRLEMVNKPTGFEAVWGENGEHFPDDKDESNPAKERD